MEEKKTDYMAWIRWLLVVATVVTTWLASRRDQPIVIPAPPAIQIVPFAMPATQSACTCSTTGIEAKAEIARVRPLRNLLIKALKKRLPAEYTDAQIDAAFAQIEAESDRPFLDWFTNGGFEKLLEMILRILTLLK